MISKITHRKEGEYFTLIDRKHPKSLCFSDRSNRNRKSNEIGGYLEAILRVLELIFGRVNFKLI